MNKLVKYILIIGFLIGISSCSNDDFDIDPQHLDTNDTFFSSEEAFRYTVDGAYDAFKGNLSKQLIYFNSDNGSSIIMADALSDNLILCPDGRGSNKSTYNWSYGPSDGVGNLYMGAYDVISVANTALDNLYKLPKTPFMVNIEAEAKAIRAIAHFDIVRAYAKIPTQSSDALNSIGIAYVTTFDPNQKPSRLSTVGEVYNKILEDLNFAYTNINNDNGQGRLNKLSVLGMLNRVYLYLGDWDKVIQTGTQIISQSPSVGSLANFPNIWKDSSEDGVLFKILNRSGGKDNTNIGAAYNQKTKAGIKSEFVVDYDFFSKFKNTDVRKSSYILTSSFNGSKYNNIIKYSSKSAAGSSAGVIDVKYLRTAEIYLNTIEAYLAKGDDASALNLLNILRSERYTSFVPGTESGKSLKDAAQLERRLELAFENDRFYTLKRQGKDIIRSNFGPYADGSGAPQTTSLYKSINDFRFQLPIPLTARNLNPNLVQNSEYEK